MVRKILILTKNPFRPDQCGSGAYLSDLIASLAREGYEVHVALLSPLGGLLRSVNLAGLEPRCVRYHLPGGIRVGSRLLSPLAVAVEFIARLSSRVISKGSYQSVLFWFESKWLRRLCRRIHPCCLVANYYHTMNLAPVVARRLGLPIVALTHDVWSRKAEEFAAAGVAMMREPISRSKEMELLEPADLLVAITESDRQSFRDMFPNKPIALASMSVEAKPWVEVIGSPMCLFVGSKYSANIAGLQWFFDSIWSIVREKVPGATLEVCGNICDAFDSANLPENVQLRGRVPSLEPFYRRAWVVIAPLTAGSGLKIKIVEALGFGRGVLTTPVGAVGFLQGRSEGVLVAEGATNFGETLADLLADLNRTSDLARAALDQSKACFGSRSSHRELLDWLKQCHVNLSTQANSASP